jgi:hypothetical protein
VNEADLKRLRDAGIIDDAKLAEIRAFLSGTAATSAPASAQASPPVRFDLTHVLWYAGALIIMGAMGLFTTAAFGAMGGWALFACGLAYGIVFGFAGDRMWRKPGMRTPAGLMIAIAVSMVPLAIYGLQDALGLWSYGFGDPGQYRDFFNWVNGSWLYMEIATILVAALAVWRYPFSFILLVAGIALWFMSMDLAMWFTARPDGFDEFEMRRQVSLFFGIAMIFAAWAMDIMSRRDGPDLAFWIHIFGAMAFWGGLSMTSGGTAFTKFLYLLINVGLVGLSVFLGRRVYAVFGALGISFYLGDLAYNVFNDVILFSFALSAIGLGIIGIGLLVHRHSASIARTMDGLVPEALRWARPERARTI